ncbi:aminoglycoside phosphotransferase family protein [Acidobacteriia bacterium AH_259_A11_L15]|nr:aminoglycoside phosphotransferase family protein [Acidobacteriia bacterium AH_259_A11_L15]
MKIHRDPSEQSQVFTERNILSYLQTRSGLSATSVPRVILCEKITDRWVLVQSVLEGRPMVAAMTRDGRPELEGAASNLRLAADWLAQLHTATRARTAAIDSLLKQHALNTIQEFASIFDLSKSERNYLNGLGDRLDAATGGGVSVQHGDFCRHNILVSRNSRRTEVAVIDWTFSKRAGLPLHDLFFFLTTYFLQVRKHHGITGFIRAFADTFLDRNTYSSIVKRCLTGHCRQLNVDVSMVETLFAMFLVERAVFEFHQVLRCSRRGGLPRFTLYLAGVGNRDYAEAVKAQLWIHFFKILVARPGQFIA